jgi:hypothetical protein
VKSFPAPYILAVPLIFCFFFIKKKEGEKIVGTQIKGLKDLHDYDKSCLSFFLQNRVQTFTINN